MTFEKARSQGGAFFTLLVSYNILMDDLIHIGHRAGKGRLASETALPLNTSFVNKSFHDDSFLGKKAYKT